MNSAVCGRRWTWVHLDVSICTYMYTYIRTKRNVLHTCCFMCVASYVLLHMCCFICVALYVWENKKKPTGVFLRSTTSKINQHEQSVIIFFITLQNQSAPSQMTKHKQEGQALLLTSALDWTLACNILVTIPSITCLGHDSQMIHYWHVYEYMHAYIQTYIQTNISHIFCVEIKLAFVWHLALSIWSQETALKNLNDTRYIIDMPTCIPTYTHTHEGIPHILCRNRPAFVWTSSLPRTKRQGWKTQMWCRWWHDGVYVSKTGLAIRGMYLWCCFHTCTRQHRPC
jgi:hypothetical protein